jgi:hypothetical protein
MSTLTIIGICLSIFALFFGCFVLYYSRYQQNKAHRNLFELFYQSFKGEKRSLKVEFADFKEHHPNWIGILPQLLPAFSKEEFYRIDIDKNSKSDWQPMAEWLGTGAWLKIFTKSVYPDALCATHLVSKKIDDSEQDAKEEPTIEIPFFVNPNRHFDDLEDEEESVLIVSDDKEQTEAGEPSLANVSVSVVPIRRLPYIGDDKHDVVIPGSAKLSMTTDEILKASRQNSDNLKRKYAYRDTIVRDGDKSILEKERYHNFLEPERRLSTFWGNMERYIRNYYLHYNEEEFLYYTIAGTFK